MREPRRLATRVRRENRCGTTAALWERQRSGKGHAVDAVKIDGSSVVVHLMWGMRDPTACGPTSAGPTCSTSARATTTIYGVRGHPLTDERQRNMGDITRCPSRPEVKLLPFTRIYDLLA
jgi:hypothetical protein